ncbi:glycosyltransferase family 2 protein [Saccharicrinis sp. FJH54]|uniref:glycosyltransferase family 2 protein n=1 Tax=Saccharicrinis sp. FJH54 TaxID=3344665 RepID=UPI0035D42917
MKIAVVILNWNGRALLEQFLPSVTQYSADKDTVVVVADNGSTDDSVDFVKKTYPTVQILQLEENYGFALGYNKALEQIDAEYYVLLNSDVEVTEGWLKPLIAYLDAHPDVAACGPKILDYKDKTKFEYAGAAGGFIDKYAYPYCRGRMFNTVEADNGQYDTITDCLWVSGACLMVRAAVYRQHAGLDERFFAHMEEIDFCWRLNNSGLKVVNIPQSVIYHVGGASLAMGNPRKTFLNFRNSLLCLYKNTEKEKLSYILFRRLILDGIAAVKFLLTDSPAHFMAVYRAHRAFFKLKKFYGPLEASVPVFAGKKLVWQGSIVIAYYFKKVHKYTSLTKYSEQYK